MNKIVMIGRDLKKGIKIITGGAGEVAEKVVREAERLRLKFQIENIERELGSSYRDLGMVSFERIINGEKDLHKDEEIKKIMNAISENSLKKDRLLAEEGI